jgi:hypothetical protein
VESAELKSDLRVFQSFVVGKGCNFSQLAVQKQLVEIIVDLGGNNEEGEFEVVV